MEDEYTEYCCNEFCWHVAEGSGKSADLILHCEPAFLKHRNDAMCDLKIKEGWAYLGFELIYARMI
jgi:hypothetical protein